MNAEQLAALEQRACTRKAKMGPVRARNVAEALNARGNSNQVRPYRCPWCRCWHVGHPPSMEGVKQIADAIRSRKYPAA